MPFLQNNDRLQILIADDSKSIRSLLEQSLASLGYDVTTCADGNEAWNIIAKGKLFHILLLDWIMPGISGVDLCRRIRQSSLKQYIYIILLTGKSSPDEIVEGLESGADDYLIKPVSFSELQARINVGKRIVDYEQEIKTKEYKTRLSCYKGLTLLAEERDHETGEHLVRISSLAKSIGEAAGCSPMFCQQLEIFAPMHDIGKVGIPDEILHLPRSLTDDEFSVVKTHSEKGWEILKQIKTLEPAADIAYTHHEKWDGSGYPRGLKGENIPLMGRIVALADVYDALRSDRIYKKAFPHEKALNIIKEGSGSQFDPDLTESFLSVEKDLEYIFNSSYDQQKIRDQIAKNTK